jgi:hypothetical protein
MGGKFRLNTFKTYTELSMFSIHIFFNVGPLESVKHETPEAQDIA